MKFLVVMCRNIAAWELALDPGEEFRIDRHHVFVLPVHRTLFHHPNLSVTLDNLGLDLADLFMNQIHPILLPVENRFARFLYTIRAQRIRGARPPEGRLRFLPRFEQRLLGPLWCEGGIRRLHSVEELYNVECCGRSVT